VVVGAVKEGRVEPMNVEDEEERVREAVRGRKRRDSATRRDRMLVWGRGGGGASGGRACGSLVPAEKRVSIRCVFVLELVATPVG
jgi:hypothetical protein